MIWKRGDQVVVQRDGKYEPMRVQVVESEELEHGEEMTGLVLRDQLGCDHEFERDPEGEGIWYQQVYVPVQIQPPIL